MTALRVARIWTKTDRDRDTKGPRAKNSSRTGPAPPSRTISNNNSSSNNSNKPNNNNKCNNSNLEPLRRRQSTGCRTSWWCTCSNRRNCASQNIPKRYSKSTAGRRCWTSCLLSGELAPSSSLSPPPISTWCARRRSTKSPMKSSNRLINR